MSEQSKGRAIGVGGVFFRSPDPDRLGSWYRDNLGIAIESWGDTRGTSFAPADMPDNSFTVWSLFKQDTEYFGKSSQAFMMNLIVDDLDLALRRVALGGAEVLTEREEADFGRFGWFIDPDGNRVELWEPPAEMPQAPNDGGE